MESPSIKPDTELDVERLAILVNAFGKALALTPIDEPLIDRGRAALRVLPLPFLQALGDAADVLVGLVAERVAELTSEGQANPMQKRVAAAADTADDGVPGRPASP